MKIGILLSGLWLLFAASPAFAATEADCPTVDLETKTIEGIWRGGEFPRFSMELPDGTLFFLGARQEEIEKAFGTAPPILIVHSTTESGIPQGTSVTTFPCLNRV